MLGRDSDVLTQFEFVTPSQAEVRRAGQHAHAVLSKAAC